MATATKRHLKFQGFYNPRTTPVPDNFFDEVMPDLSGAELKVLLYVFRRTFGFKKDRDNISLSQMVAGIVRKDGTLLDRGTGLGKGSVARALNTLVEKGIIKKTRRRSRQNGDQPTSYEPVMADLPVSQFGTPPVPKLGHPRVPSGDPQETVHKKQFDNTVNGGQSPVMMLPLISRSPAQTALLAREILDQLGDRHSRHFYELVAAKLPEHVIRTALAEIRSDGADDPPRVFTFRMNHFALKRLKQGIGRDSGTP